MGLPIGWRAMDGAVMIPLQPWAGFAFVDECDVPRIRQFHWYAHRERNKIYVRSDVCAGGKRERLLMHRLIMEAKAGQIIDHKNGSALDNRRDNLRLATNSQNIANSGSRGGSSEFKGVTWIKSNGTWRTQIGYGSGKRYSIDGFHDELTAACAYDLLAQHFHGEFARLNVGVLFLQSDIDGTWTPVIQAVAT